MLLTKAARHFQAENGATEQLPPPSEEHLNDGVEDAEEDAARMQGTDIEQGQVCCQSVCAQLAWQHHALRHWLCKTPLLS